MKISKIETNRFDGIFHCTKQNSAGNADHGAEGTKKRPGGFPPGLQSNPRGSD